MSYQDQAAEKLKAEYAQFKGDRYQSVMKSAVLEALLEFCRQNEEFAQAVAQGGSFARMYGRGIQGHQILLV